MTTWLRLLVAFIVFCHGFIYIRIGSVLPSPIKEWKRTSWLLGSAVMNARLPALVVALHVMAGIATVACALAIGLADSVPGWWRPLAMAGSVLGIAPFSVFWDGQSKLLFEEGAVGAILSMILLASGRLRFPRRLASEQHQPSPCDFRRAGHFCQPLTYAYRHLVEIDHGMMLCSGVQSERGRGKATFPTVSLRVPTRIHALQ